MAFPVNSPFLSLSHTHTDVCNSVVIIPICKKKKTKKKSDMQKPKLSRDCRVYNLNKCVVPTSASGSSCYDTLGRMKRSWDLCFSDLFPDSFDMARGYLTPSILNSLCMHAFLHECSLSLLQQNIMIIPYFKLRTFFPSAKSNTHSDCSFVDQT